MALRITCIVYNVEIFLHIPRYSYHFESLCLLVVAPWLAAELAFSSVQPAALAIRQALKDIPLAPLIILSFALPPLESSTFFIVI